MLATQYIVICYVFTVKYVCRKYGKLDIQLSFCKVVYKLLTLFTALSKLQRTTPEIILAQILVPHLIHVFLSLATFVIVIRAEIQSSVYCELISGQLN